MLRLYWPKETPPSILDGTWKIPAVKKVQKDYWHNSETRGPLFARKRIANSLARLEEYLEHGGSEVPDRPSFQPFRVA